MNRKDFELVAATVKAWPLIGKERLAAMMADAIGKSSQCSGFDREKFIKACGVSNAASE